jgi:Flp pilus assembly protein TadG
MMDTGKSRYNRRGRGQTVVETIFMLLFLLFLFFLIAEFARAWYLKNSLNNAARVGVRVAVVTQNLSDISETACQSASGPVLEAVCSSPGLTNTTVVSVSIVGDVPPPAAPFASSGDTIQVSLSADFTTFVPLLLPLVPEKAVSDASMRYE